MSGSNTVYTPSLGDTSHPFLGVVPFARCIASGMATVLPRNPNLMGIAQPGATLLKRSYKP